MFRQNKLETIDLIGSEGFIGKAINRNKEDLLVRKWSHKESNNCRKFDLYNRNTWSMLLEAKPRTVILLSWPKLPYYDKEYHLEENLPALKDLILTLIENGMKKLVVTGTCYEYGDYEGKLKETLTSKPNNRYAQAKDNLRKYIEYICTTADVDWVWIRIFYIYGEGQNKNALLQSLENAIKSGDKTFPMSDGNQERDFLHVDEIAKMLLEAANNKDAKGIYNGGSGKPISLSDLAKQKKHEMKSSIKLLYGAKDVREGEPYKAWADMRRWKALKPWYD